MKTLLISSLIAASAAFGVVVPANAASVTITTTQHVEGPRDNRHDYHPYHRRPVVERCFYKTEHHERHGRMIVVRTKVCR